MGLPFLPLRAAAARGLKVSALTAMSVLTFMGPADPEEKKPNPCTDDAMMVLDESGSK
jgi:hypothetical protein